MQELEIFKKEEFEVRVIEIDGESWFVAKDVCEALGIVNIPQAMGQLDEDENLLYVLDISGQKREMYLISESGLYSLVLRSNKPNAKVFKKWITKEVLPSIRKTGGYSVQQLPDFTNPVIAARAWADEVEKKQIAEAKVKELAPKADAYDVISNSRRLSSVSQVSALFGLGRNRLYKMLKEAKFVMENNKPYQKWIDSGHFDYKIDKVNGKQYFVTLITGKGIQLLQKEFQGEEDE